MVFLALWRAFLNCFLMAFLVHRSWSDLSCHFWGETSLAEQSTCERALWEKGKKKEISRGKSRKAEAVEGGWGACPLGGPADVLVEHACSWGLSSDAAGGPRHICRPFLPQTSVTSGSRTAGSLASEWCPLIVPVCPTSCCASALPALPGPFHCHPLSPSLSFSSSYAISLLRHCLSPLPPITPSPPFAPSSTPCDMYFFWDNPLCCWCFLPCCVMSLWKGNPSHEGLCCFLCF